MVKVEVLQVIFLLFFISVLFWYLVCFLIFYFIGKGVGGSSSASSFVGGSELGGNDKKNASDGSGDGGEAENEECLESEFVEDVIGADELPKDSVVVCLYVFGFLLVSDTCFNVFYL